MENSLLKKAALLGGIIIAGFGIKSITQSDDPRPSSEHKEKIEQTQQTKQKPPTEISEDLKTISTQKKESFQSHNEDIQPNNQEDVNSPKNRMKRVEGDREHFLMSMEIAQGTNITDLNQHDLDTLKNSMGESKSSFSAGTGVTLKIDSEGEISATRHILLENGDIEIQSAGNSRDAHAENPINSPVTLSISSSSEAAPEFLDTLRSIRDNPYDYIGKEEQKYSSTFLEIQNEIDSEPSSAEKYINQGGNSERSR